LSNPRTPEALLAADVDQGTAEELTALSTEDIADAEEAESASDAFTEADARTERIELQNDAIDELANQAQEISDEGIDADGHDRG
jgi:transcription termination/antitermination protein NusA